ncbi:LIM and calponin homology domains-containing protein 1a [Clarias gariepinus]|uniref:LIM and calponin homology domains-containing protein 1a n=1 Tax=Clarias gariepinus TaxID=13013 RepID=UPI00234C80A5|nr:LIM and calponin homology domains-containing protein 1a [Clarias gariepinus]
MASADEGSGSRPDHHEAAECGSGPAFQEAQKWIEAVTGRSFGEKDFRSSLENGILLCELLSSIKPGLVKKINRLPTPIAGLDNLTMFLRGCEELGLKGSQLFDPGDLQDMSIRANLTGSDCSRKLKNVLITIYWLGKTVNGCASYSGPTLNLKEFEGVLSMKECVSEEPESPKRSVRDSGCVDNWESEHSDSLSPPRHRREDSFDSLDSFSSQSQPMASPDTALRANSDDLEADHRKVPDVLKDDMSARRVSYKEPRAALPFNQYLPNKSNQSAFVPAHLRKRRSEREEERRSGSNSTSPIREECVGISRETPLALNSQKTVTWVVEGGAEPQLDEAELKKMKKLEKAGIKVLPASVRYSSPKVTAVEPDQAKSPSPDIIRRCDNTVLRAEHTHEWDEEDEDEEGDDRKVPDIQKDDLASRRARMNRPKPNVAHQFLPSSCSSKDRERWEGIRLSSQHAVLEMLEKMEQDKKSEPDTTPAEGAIVTRKDNPFLSPRGKKKAEEEESEEEDEGKAVVPNVQKDDLARRRTQLGSVPQRDPRQSLAQTSITQSDLKKWQRLSMTIESSEATPVEVSIITRKDNPFLSTEKARAKGNDDDEEEEEEIAAGGQAALPNIQKDDLARRRSQTGGLPHRDHQQTLAQTALTQSDLEKWQRLKMSTENSGDSGPLTSPLKSSQSSISDPKHTLTFAEREALELRLAEKVKDEKEYEEEEEEEEKERQPDLKKDDMMARRTGVFQNAGGKVRNRFLPLPGSKKETRPAVSAQEESTGDPFMERNIKTKRFKVGQRAEQVKPEPTVPSTVTQKEPESLGSTPTHADDSYKHCGNYDEDNDEGPLHNPEKDDMLARRTGSYQKPSGNQFNAFLPKPGGVRSKKKNVSGQCEPNLTIGEQPTQSPTPRSVTLPPADVDGMPRKCLPVLDGQKTDTVAMLGGEVDVVGGAQAQSPLPLPDPDARHKFGLDDDVFPLKFSHMASSVSDETESVSLNDMRDEEEDVDSLSPHSQTRHERLHNQYNKVKEEEDQWQDDLARWKNRRRSASQDLIRKEEERKMMEKLMKTEGGAHRRKSIKTYKEIVEEKERREQELHELYLQAATPEEKAAILQRYALRFTISDAILEKLQLPKLPSAVTIQSAAALNEEAEISESRMCTDVETDSSDQITQTITHKSPELTPIQASRTPQIEAPLSPSRTTISPEVPVSPVWIPPAPSRPVPLLTAKPYSQPKFNQPSYKQVKNDGLVRVNGDSIPEDARENPVRPVSFTPSPPKPASQSPQREQEILAGTETTAQECTQTLPGQKAECVKEETDFHSIAVQKRRTEDEASKTLTESELTGKQTVPDMVVKRNCMVKTTIVTELREKHLLPVTDAPIPDQMSCSEGLSQKSDESSRKSDFTSCSEGIDFTSECIETPILNLAKRVNHWTWDPNEERKRQERWQQEQERLLQEKYQQEQERLKQEWEKAQKEVEEEERKHHEEEQRILEETVAPLTPHSSSGVTEAVPTSTTPHHTIVLSLADWDRKQEMLEKEAKMNQKNGFQHRSDQTKAPSPPQQIDQKADLQESQSATPQLQFTQDVSWSCKSESKQEWKKTASLDRNVSPSLNQPPRMRRSGSYENILGIHTSPSSQDTSPSSPDRSVSAKKLCSSCAQPLGKGAAMIIDSLGLFFHIQCFKCGVCKGLLGDSSSGTDVRIRNGVLNCHSCYMKSRAAGQPTTL